MNVVSKGEIGLIGEHETWDVNHGKLYWIHYYYYKRGNFDLLI